MFGSASLIVINKAVPKTLIQSSALLNCDNGPWSGLPCASSSDDVHGFVVSGELMESAEMGKGKKASREHARL